MARHNIVFGRDEAVQRGSAAPQYGMPAADTQWSGSFDASQGQRPQYGQSQWGQGQYSQPFAGQGHTDNLEAMYARPAATSHDTGMMTMRDALNAITATMAVIIVVGSAVAFAPAALGLVAGEDGANIGYFLAMCAMGIGLIGGLVFALINTFKRQPSMILTLLYAVFEGLALGGMSGLMEAVYPGIALQAVLATFSVAAVVFGLTQLGVLRTSPVLNKIFVFAMLAYLLFGLVNIGFLLITGTSLRDGLIGLAIGGIAVCMASYSLVMDIEDVKRAASGYTPRKYAWRCAFGVAVTLVWMYIEILRILAILRGND